MKRLLSIVLFAVMLATTSVAQSYVQTPVTISKQKVKSNGKVYYSHVVLERQTLYSISKAYGVTIGEIYDANKNLELETKGLKKNQILLIPTESALSEEEVVQAAEKAEEQAAQAVSASTDAKPAPAYKKYIAKWYDDLSSIARKFNTTEEELMKINNLTSERIKKGQELLVPAKEGDTPALDVPKVEEKVVEKVAPADNTRVEEVTAIVPQTEGEPAHEDVNQELAQFFQEAPVIEEVRRPVSAAVVLPFKAGDGVGNDNMFDFYNGVLLAVNDLQKEGFTVSLSALDCAAGLKDFGSTAYDLVIGPVGATDIQKVLAKCSGSEKVVSPLDARTVSMANVNSRFIQAPCPVEEFQDDIARWVSEEYQPSDSVYVFAEKGVEMPAKCRQMIATLKECGVKHRVVKYGILEGRTLIEKMLDVNNFTKVGTNRILIASESQAFVQDVIRNANVLIYSQIPAVVYATSKVLTFETIEVDHFHNTNMRVSLSYFTDYNSPEVKHFLMEYRALFNCEPNQFAFQGYDIAYIFLKRMALYGENWTSSLAYDKARGLQSDFKLVQSGNGNGHVNKAVRRVIYAPGYDVKVL